MEYIIPTNKTQALDELLHYGHAYGFESKLITREDITHIFFIPTAQTKKFYDSVLYLDYMGFYVLMKHGLRTSKIRII